MKQRVFALTGTYEDKTLIFIDLDTVVEQIKLDLEDQYPNYTGEYKIEIREMTEEELENLPEAD